MFVGGTDRNIIKGNTIVNALRGIVLETVEEDSADDNKILDNTILSSGSSGVDIFEPVGVDILGNKRAVIQGNTISQSGGYGIKVVSSGPFDNEGVIIKDNSITNSNEAGIAIGPASKNTVVIGSTLAGNGNNDIIDDQGTGTIKAGNVPNQM